MKVTLVRCPEWEALYINGWKTDAEGHSLTVRDVLRELDVDWEERWVNEKVTPVEDYLPDDIDKLAFK